MKKVREYFDKRPGLVAVMIMGASAALMLFACGTFYQLLDTIATFLLHSINKVHCVGLVRALFFMLSVVGGVMSILSGI